MVHGLLLAAGAGRRMGQPKALMHDPDGTSWLVRSIDVLKEGGCEDVTVVLGALPYAADAVVVSLVDLPDVDAAVVRRVAAAASGSGALARAAYDGVPGHPVLIGSTHWAAVATEVAGDAGARSYLARHDVVLVECGDLATGRDVDRRD
jgi:CTP:molybdopterin cytidylyltransferase MocA